MKVLIVEDEPELLLEIEAYLGSQAYLCEKASSFLEAEEKIGLYQYDLIVLDVGLPGGNGLDLLERKWNRQKPGILILSAKDSLDDKLKGLNLGADDYLTKPFHLAELNARLLALCRRKNEMFDNKLQYKGLIIDLDNKELFLDGEAINLTLKEYQLMEYFIINKDRVLSKQNLAEHLWGDNYDMVDNYDFLYVQIKNLRRKLKTSLENDYIKTIHGIGYKLFME